MLISSGIAGFSAVSRCCAALLLSATTIALVSCSSNMTPGAPVNLVTSPLSVYGLQGDVSLIHDPAIVRQGSNYYVLSTDGGQSGNLPIFCSADKTTWKRCGQVFNSIPAYVTAIFPAQTTLWAPDVSYFNGLYHVYYVASQFGTKNSIIGLATSPTMNPSDPNYLWTDSGAPILQSPADGSGYNAIDPSIFIDTDSSGAVMHVWLTYGSFYNGIAQREINPTTGKLLAAQSTAPIQLATRPGVVNNPLEGPSLVKHNGFYYLFLSFDYCCNNPFTTDNYKIVVGRGTSANGPFTDMGGTAMLNGGGTVLLQSAGEFTAPGGQDVVIDPANGDLIAFHALSNTQNGFDYLFVKSLTWPSDWPLIAN